MPFLLAALTPLNERIEPVKYHVVTRNILVSSRGWCVCETKIHT